MKVKHIATIAAVSIISLGFVGCASDTSGSPDQPGTVEINPCAGKNPCAGNPCAGNPCAGNPCAGNPCAGNPCAGNPCAGNPCAGK